MLHLGERKARAKLGDLGAGAFVGKVGPARH